MCPASKGLMTSSERLQVAEVVGDADVVAIRIGGRLVFSGAIGRLLIELHEAERRVVLLRIGAAT